MNPLNSSKNIDKNDAIKPEAFSRLGIQLIILAVMIIILAKVLDIQWLSFFIVPLSGTLFILFGIRQKSILFSTAGTLILTAGTSLIFAVGPMFSLVWNLRVGLGMVTVAIGVLGLIFFTSKYSNKTQWWPLLVTGSLFGASIPFFLYKISFLDFVYHLSLGLGLTLIIWGIIGKYMGLIIPGSIAITSGPGVFFAWGVKDPKNGLVQTGEMLVWIGLGWALIVLLSRVTQDNFVWWPVIPFGVFFIVGWALYIAGNPQRAPTFISNSSTVIILIVGIYLLLLRRRIRK